MELLVGAILGAIASLILSLIFTPIFQDRVTDFLVEHLSRFSFIRKKTSLTGSWTQDWQVDGRESIAHQEPELELKQLGHSLVGKFKFSGREYRLRAKIENGIYVSGTWFDLYEGPTYHGTFQARIKIDGHSVAGKWIGFSSTLSSINTGDWLWQRDI